MSHLVPSKLPYVGQDSPFPAIASLGPLLRTGGGGDEWKERDPNDKPGWQAGLRLRC